MFFIPLQFCVEVCSDGLGEYACWLYNPSFFVIGPNKLGAVIIILLNPRLKLIRTVQSTNLATNVVSARTVLRNKCFSSLWALYGFSRLVLPLESRHSCCFKFGRDYGGWLGQRGGGKMRARAGLCRRSDFLKPLGAASSVKSLQATTSARVFLNRAQHEETTRYGSSSSAVLPA